MHPKFDRFKGAETRSSLVVARFCLRLVVLAGFGLASSQPFWAVLATLLVVAAGLSATIAGTRREPLFGAALTHWDEAAIYGLLSRGVVTMSATSLPGG